MCMFNMNNLVLETQPNECKAKGDAINHKSETLGHHGSEHQLQTINKRAIAFLYHEPSYRV